jgi:hypothetical protein
MFGSMPGKPAFPHWSRAAKATVHRILAAQPLHPEKVQYYCQRRDKTAAFPPVLLFKGTGPLAGTRYVLYMSF